MYKAFLTDIVSKIWAKNVQKSPTCGERVSTIYNCSSPSPGREGRKTLLGDKAEVRDKISRDILALALISCYYWNRMTLFIQYWLNVVSGTKQQSELAVKFVYDAELRCVLWRVQASMRNRSYHVNVQWHHFINIFRQYRVHWNSNFCTWCFPEERTRKML